MGDKTTGPAGRVARRWTSGEVAFILNYPDYCKTHGLDCNKTIVNDFSRFTGSLVTMNAIMGKLYRLLEAHDVTTRAFLDNGTRLLKIKALPEDVLAAVQRQRQIWKLVELDTGAGTESSGPSGDALSAEVTTDTISLKRKASIQSSQASNMSHHQQSVSDSEVSSVSDSTESEYDEQHAKKKPKTSSIAQTRPPLRQHSRKPSPGKGQAVEERKLQKDATKKEQPLVKSTQSRKRKLNTAEVIDLGNASSPPPAKPPALDAVHDGTFGSTSISKVSVPSSENSLSRSSEAVEKRSSRGPPSVPNTLTEEADGYTLVQEPLRAKTAVPSSDMQTAPPPVPTAQSADDITALEMVKDLAQLVGVLLREQVTFGFGGMTEDIEHRLKGMRRTVEREPGGLFDNLLFPKVLDVRQILAKWETLCETVKHAFGFGPFDPNPKPEDAGYVAARIDDLTKNLPIHGLDASKEFVEEIVLRLESPYLVRSVLGALLCQWLFSGPEPMCIDAYSLKERKLYESLLFTRPDEVQHLDKVSMKALFEDKNFQNSQLKSRAYKLATSMKLALKHTWPGAPGFDENSSPQRWAEEALQFKQALMIDRDEYRIHYCMPGTLFDPSWMKAEDNEGFPVQVAEAEGKQVVTCLFPALSRCEARPLPQDPTVDTLDSLLVANKRFFPSFKEKQAFDPQQVVAKAVAVGERLRLLG
ncbi:hypothetical protein IQ06DRAFT_323380 [Phaeosphaeriaceae sp. SRC1lsM3a]|nr:hypothetical protein IQ06DRAFT_323380 [Stagonospora sp. SRC1lsM3a]